MGEFRLAQKVLLASAPRQIPGWKGKDERRFLRNGVDRNLLFQLAHLQELSGEEEGALEGYLALGAIEGRSSRVVEGAARCLLELGLPQPAYEQLIKRENAPRPGRTAFSFELYHALLALGRFAEAFDFYRLRPLQFAMRKIVTPQRYPFGRLLSRSLESLFVVAEGGPGDEVRFASLYPELLVKARKVTATTDPRLRTIMERTFPEISFIPVYRHYRWEPFKTLEADFYQRRAHLTSLIAAMVMDNASLDEAMRTERVVCVTDLQSELRRDAASFPVMGGYLKTDQVRSGLWRERLKRLCGPKIKVGLSWRSVLASTVRDRHYSIAEDWEALFACPDISVVNLQPLLTQEERQAISRRGWSLQELEIDLVNDFENQGSVIQALDWVVSPCNTTLEFAGALGVRSILVARSEQLAWRRRPDGSDLWHDRVQVVLAHRERDFRNSVEQISSDYFPIRWESGSEGRACSTGANGLGAAQPCQAFPAAQNPRLVRCWCERSK